MALEVYNTLTRKKEEFKPIAGNRVNMFVCGPTVYDDSHIGHGKTYTQFDIIVRYLRWKKFDVFYLMNITDIDDKIIARAKERKQGWEELAREYEERFYKDMKTLGNDSVDEFARATSHVKQIIKQVRDLVEKGYGYETSDGIYFEISKFSEYGKLSKQDLSRIKEGARVEVSEEKKGPGDFVLWKKHKPGDPFWESPWGKGRPGWHIEDTAITETYFGPQYDLHGGAVDLIFPHHECEIAQMEAASGRKPLVKYWLHTAFLNIGKDKMSKSLGNIIPIRQAIEKWGAKTLRYYYASNHYRTSLDYDEEGLQHSQNSLRRLNNFVKDLQAVKGENENEEIDRHVEELLVKFEERMDDDFDTPGAVAVIFDFMHDVNSLDLGRKDAGKALKALEVVDSVFQVLEFEQEEIPREVTELAERREEARAARDWAKADELREDIKKKGYTIEDTKEGYRIKRG